MRRILCIALFLVLLCSFALADMDVYFIDVGQADASVIICDGSAMMIDGGNVGDSQLIYSYLKNTLKLKYLDVIIATHPHEDHIGGLPAALNAVSVGNIYSPVTEYDSEVFSDLLKYAPAGLTVPEVGDTFQIGGATVTIVNVNSTESEDVNDWSIVTRIDYGDTSFLFTGDAESIAEDDMLHGNIDLNCDVLKVGHHGSDSSSTQEFIEEVSPKYAVISVGADNEYGHPTDEVLNRLNSIGATIYRTDLNGNIICHSDGASLTFETEKSLVSTTPVPDTTESTEAEYKYIGNKNSHKLHYPNCDSVDQMKDKNKVYFTSREEAISEGYEPCKNCQP